MRHSVFTGLGALAVLALGAATSPETFAAFTWRSEPPPSCPFARSETVTAIEFTGRHIKYFGADTWYPSWAKDGNLYSPWTDGIVDGLRADSNGMAKANTGFAILAGGDPLHLRLIEKGTYPAPAAPYGGRYPSASLFYRGVWYYGTYCLMDSDGDPGKGLNWDILGPFVGLRISYDNGRSWVETPHTPARPIFPEPAKAGGKVRFGAPHFVDFGPELRDSPDGKAYLVAHGASDPDPEPRPANASWITGDQVFLARVTPDPKTVNNFTAWEFYAGKDAAGEPIWSHDFGRVKPLLDWNNHLGNVSITYDRPLKKYLMAITDGGDTVSKFNTMVLEADRITGPWRIAVFMKNFGEQAYFVNFPSKFIGKDGRILWMCYSANFSNGVPEWPHHDPNPPGSGYGLILQEVRLLAGRQN